jgi:hypothetical protein
MTHIYNEEKMLRKHLYLNKLQIQKLEKEAREKQLKVSELIRRIIDKHYESGDKNESKD